MKFVPEELQNENSPCRFIPLNEKGETIDYFFQLELRAAAIEALAGWLRKQTTRIEQQLAKSIGPLLEECDELWKVAET